eukprot:scaffold9252_cov34-Tisochrysis_lutea.AAC.5
MCHIVSHRLDGATSVTIHYHHLPMRLCLGLILRRNAAHGYSKSRRCNVRTLIQCAFYYPYDCASKSGTFSDERARTVLDHVYLGRDFLFCYYCRSSC